MAIPKKPRTCRVCKTVFQPSKPLQNVCGIECAMEAARITKEKQKAKQAKAERIAQEASVKILREKLKTAREWVKEVQVAFNLYIRLRDQLAGHPCISSGKPLDWSGNNVDAGHYRSTGSAPHLRFDERNCHAQSKQDNRYLAGNAVDYRIGLIKRIGLSEVEALEADQAPRKYSIDELKQLKAHYKQKANWLKGLIAERAQQ